MLSFKNKSNWKEYKSDCYSPVESSLFDPTDTIFHDPSTTPTTSFAQNLGVAIPQSPRIDATE